MIRTSITVTSWAILGSFALAQNPIPNTPPAQRAASGGAIAVSSSTKAETVFSNIATAPTSDVPGFPGQKFTPGSSTTTFVRPFGSPNGNWILTADTDTGGTADDEVVIVNGVVVLREGDPAPWDLANNMGPFDDRVQINDMGDFMFANNLTPTTTNDDYIIRVTGGTTFIVEAQEAAAIPALPGSTYDDTLESCILLAGGGVGFEADLIDGGTVTTSNDDIFVLNNAIVAQQGVTIPLVQAGGAMETVEFLDFEDLWANASGSRFLWQGDLSGSTSTDDVVVVDNIVVLQEGSIILGSGFADPIDLSGIVGVSMDAAGNWYARGNNDNTEQDWVVRNGLVVAAVGNPVTAGATELWDDTDFSDCFFAHVGNGLGDFIVAGVTSEASTHNGVVVWNGTDVVVRENDPVDIDNNGLFDDGLYFNTFGNDDFYLSDANELYFSATLRDAGGSTVGTGFFKINIVACAGGDITRYGDGCVGSGANAPRLSGLGCATSGGNLTVAITEGLPNSTAILFVGVAQTSLPLAGGCTLLTNPIISLALPLNAAGSLTLPAVLPATTAVTVDLQAFNIDSGVSWGFSATNGLSISIQ